MTERARKIREGKRERFLALLRDGSKKSEAAGALVVMTPALARIGYDWITELLEELEMDNNCAGCDRDCFAAGCVRAESPAEKALREQAETGDETAKAIYEAYRRMHR